MAFGEKFNLDFVDLIRNNSWEIKIFEEGYLGGIDTVVGSGEPLTINWLESDLFESIGASECIVELESITNFQFKEFLKAIPNQFLINIKKNGSLYWQGVNVTDNNTEPYDDVPYTTELKFTDGLGQLKFTEFEDSGLVSGRANILEIIVACLNKLPFQLDIVEMINVVEDNIVPAPINFRFLNTTFMDRHVFRNFSRATQSFEGWNCLKVIDELLHSIGATIYQSNNEWRIVRIEEYEAASVPFIRYAAGTTIPIATGTQNIRLTIDNNAESGISWINRSGDLNVSKAFDEIEYIYKYGSPDQDPGELISDHDFSLSVAQIPNAFQFDLWEVGPGYLPGLGPEKFSVLGNDYYYKVPTTGIIYNKSSMFNNQVFDSTKFLKSLEHSGAANTREELVTTVNDNAVITFDGFLEMILGAYVVNGVDQVSQLNLPYEITFFFSVQIGLNYLEEDSDGVMSWGLNANSVVSIRKVFDLKNPLYSWRSGVLPATPPTRSFTLVFKYGPISIELPNFPENAISALNVKLFQPATPVIYPDLNNNTSAILAITLQLTPFSFEYQPLNGKILSTVFASQFSTNVKDRKKMVTVLFGDGPHSVIKNSFLALNGAIFDASTNWVKGTDLIDTFNATSVVASPPPVNAVFSGPIDHNFVAGQWVQGTGFTNSEYNRFQQITSIVDSKTFRTFAVFVGTDSGDIFNKNTHAETFILGPYGKYFGEYRDDLRGDLTGDFAFFNSFLGDNGKIYFQRGASYKIKSNEVTVQLIELDENVTSTISINQYDGIKPNISPVGPNTETSEPATGAESLTGDTRHQPETHSENMNVQVKSARVKKINQLKHNANNFRDYPAA